MPRVVMLGPPGAGKGTQGTRIASAAGVPHVSSGDLLRQALQEDESSEVGRAARTIRDGNMVSDEVAARIVFHEMEKPGAADGFVLDGFPRNRHQAEILDAYLAERGKNLTAVIALEIAESALTERLVGRLTCPGCGASYHVTADPPRAAGLCDRCGAELTTREDDQPEAIHRRIELYNERTAPLLEYYRERGLLCPIDATGDEETVYARCREALDTASAGERTDCLV